MKKLVRSAVGFAKECWWHTYQYRKESRMLDFLRQAWWDPFRSLRFDAGIPFFGYLGFRNVGDEAAYLGFVRTGICQAYPVTLGCPRILWPYKIFMAGAGGLISPLYPGLLGIPFQRKARKPKGLLVSAGLNYEINEGFGADASDTLKRVLSRYEFLSVRDVLTKDFLAELGFEDVSLVPDLAVLESDWVARTAEKGSRDSLVISVCSHSPLLMRTWDSLSDALVQGALYGAEKGLRIVLVPMQVHFRHNDLDSCYKIARTLKGKGVQSLVVRRLNTHEMMRLIYSRALLVIGVRLHASIIAYGVGRPFLCVGYSVKHRGFVGTIGLPERYVRLTEVRADDVVAAIDDAEKYATEVPPDIAKSKAVLLESLASGLSELRSVYNGLCDA